MSRFFHVLPDLYQEHIVAIGRQPQFFVLIAFLMTFVILRSGNALTRSGRRIPLLGSVSIGGLHIHHLVPGILLVLASGYIGVAVSHSHIGIVAIIFGIGAALTLDEFALWLNLRDVYWEREGRRSIDAVIIAATILGIFVVGGRFFWAVAKFVFDQLLL